MITMEQLVLGYGEREIIRHDKYHFESGTIHVLCGSNASGKTTLLSALAGNLAPLQGRIHAKKQGLTSTDTAWRNVRSYIPVNPPLFEELSVEEQLLFKAELSGLENPPAAIEDQMATFGLYDIAEERASRLSSGYRMRLACALAFMGDIPFILLDEPFNYLDIEGAFQLCDAMERYTNSGGTVIMASHYKTPLEDRNSIFHRIQEGTIERV